MKCCKCGIENEASAKFCRACGASLDSKPLENIMDKYPKYEFIPTNLIEWKKPKVSRFIFVVFLFGLLMSLSTSAYYLYSYNHYYDEKISEDIDTEYDEQNDIYIEKHYFSADYYDFFHTINGDSWRIESKAEAIQYAKNNYKRDCIPLIICFGVLAIISIIICFIVYRPYPSSTTKSIRTYADYIQKYTYTGIFSSRSKPMFRFYVKDHKFGLMDVSHYKVYLNAEYDLLSWREKGKFLTAHQGNRVFIIDINGKELK